MEEKSPSYSMRYFFFGDHPMLLLLTAFHKLLVGTNRPFSNMIVWSTHFFLERIHTVLATNTSSSSARQLELGSGCSRTCCSWAELQWALKAQPFEETDRVQTGECRELAAGLLLPCCQIIISREPPTFADRHHTTTSEKRLAILRAL